MKTFHARIATAALAGAALLAGPAVQAQNSELPALPDVQQQGDVQFLSGGIGAGQSGAFKAAARQYRLMLTFVQRGPDGRGEFLADVPVQIRNAAGQTVLDTVSQGPYLLANLPAGAYTVKASANGNDKSARITVGRSGTASTIFEWR